MGTTLSELQRLRPMTADRARARSATAPPPPFVQLSARILCASATLPHCPEAIEGKAGCCTETQFHPIPGMIELRENTNDRSSAWSNSAVVSLCSSRCCEIHREGQATALAESASRFRLRFSAESGAPDASGLGYFCGVAPGVAVLACDGGGSFSELPIFFCRCSSRSLRSWLASSSVT